MFDGASLDFGGFSADFQWILQFLRCSKYPQNDNWYFCNGSCKLPRANCRSKMALFRRNGRAKGHFVEDLTSKQLAKLCLPPKAGSIVVEGAIFDVHFQCDCRNNDLNRTCAPHRGPEALS